LAASFDPNATCPTFEKELNEKLANPDKTPNLDDQELFLSAFASGLLAGNGHAIALMLWDAGLGDTGKTTLTSWGCGSVWGHPEDTETLNRSSLTLHQICPDPRQEKNMIPALEFAQINFSGEVNHRDVPDTENLKRAISKEEISARAAWGKNRRIRPNCFFVFNCNDMPSIIGTYAEIKRFRIIRMLHKTKPEDVNEARQELIASEKDGIALKLPEATEKSHWI
jgi:hypothetical protein